MTREDPWTAPGTVALGTFEFGAAIPDATALRLMDTHHALGGRIIDTAPTYGPSADGYRAEELIGRWLTSRAVDAAVVTKAGLDPARPGKGELDPTRLIRSAHDSADRLGIPLAGFLLHRDDDTVPVDEIADACHRLVADGTVLRVGASNWTTQRLEAWIHHARSAGLTSPQVSQPLWSLARRAEPCPEPWLVEADGSHLALAAFYEITVMPYRTLAAGYLAAAHSGRHSSHHASTYDTAVNAVRRDRLRTTARSLDVPMHGLALAYLRTHPCARVVPVTGARTLRQLRETMTGAAAAAERLTPDLRAHLAGAGT
ncbi:aldo/keto reductase [Streptomyces sp. NPDC001795]|uniref:aldo/keto reductase n=1 Tax=Streptomyces sp. NPDC001795 TaxID=3154525 RepID=UPI00331853CD